MTEGFSENRISGYYSIVYITEERGLIDSIIYITEERGLIDSIVYITEERDLIDLCLHKN